ncbi:MAG: hypothetical protein ABIO86_21515 [Sphingomonas sp.]
MPFLTLDSFDAPLQWTALDAADAPSAQIVLSAVPQGHPMAVATGAMQVEISGGAAGHRLERALPATDLSSYTDLTFWACSDSITGSEPGADYRLRLELGSAALPIGAPGNDWHRYVAPLGRVGWSYLRFLLDDLPPAARAAVTTFSITVEAIDGPHMLRLDALEAQARQPSSDAEAAMLAMLDGQLDVGGNPVPAVIAPDAAAAPAEPFFRIEALRSAPSPRRAVESGSYSDFDANGYRLRPAPEPWDLFYAVDCVAQTRAEAVQLHDFLLARLGRNGWVQSGNRAFRIDSVDGALAQPGVEIPDHRRFLRIGAWIERGAITAVVPANDVALALALKPSGGVA